APFLNRRRIRERAPKPVPGGRRKEIQRAPHLPILTGSRSTNKCSLTGLKTTIAGVIDALRFREVMATFPSGVVVLTAFGEDGLPRGLTVNAFCAVSLEPPLALACIEKTSNTLPAVQRSGGFTANILAAGREQLARRMATKLSEQFDNIKWRPPSAESGGPILEEDSAAFAVCTLRQTLEAGDHWIVVGLVTDGAQREGVTPMIYSRRLYDSLGL